MQVLQQDPGLLYGHPQPLPPQVNLHPQSCPANGPTVDAQGSVTSQSRPANGPKVDAQGCVTNVMAALLEMQ